MLVEGSFRKVPSRHNDPSVALHCAHESTRWSARAPSFDLTLTQPAIAPGLFFYFHTDFDN